MKNFIYAAIVIIVIHLWFFTNIQIKQIDKISTTKQSINQSTTVKYVKLVQPKPLVQKSTPPKPIKELFKKVQSVKKKKKVYKKVPKKIKKTPKRVNKVKKRINPISTKTVPKQPVSKLESMLAAAPTNTPLDKLTLSYIKLYGKEYKKFTPKQKEYLNKNLKHIGRITQRYLRYPSIAARTQQHGTNVVEFFLHPNGDISKLRLISKRKYTALDENSIHTIQIAYQDYPRPKEVTKIRIYINYLLR